ncbi:MAG: Vitamin B12 import ATP-binding protein BtuD [Candidatus Omnitrophica bacterium]|nr:Vitamin B12 import ATP-binding protein BtuD [Candidatus Omnitrophota bacterium]
MSGPVIRVNGLSKRYRLRAATPGETLREALMARLRGRARAPEIGEVWAIRDVSFEVGAGEVLGVVGRNGSGKSTLLKVLARITDPTAGSAEIIGRVGALLEVGTGFHTELTGRENIHLNGAILGMRRHEIRAAFDRIVQFAGIEKFLDTQMKHYSSGMQTRLAFSIAAHLHPEILFVDEVLAVGDAEFQQRCMGKMGEIVREGRTVIFVSHNMQAVRNICTRALYLEKGRISVCGATEEVIEAYLKSVRESGHERRWAPAEAPHGEGVRLLRLAVSGEQSGDTGQLLSGEDILIDLECELERVYSSLQIGFDLLTVDGAVVFRSYQSDGIVSEHPRLRVGNNLLRCRIPAGYLNAGRFVLAPRIGDSARWLIREDPVIELRVTLTHGVSPFWSGINVATKPGATAPVLRWESLGGS